MEYRTEKGNKSMNLQYPKFLTYGADSYIHDGDTNYFAEFAKEYEPECPREEYREGELLEEIREAFLETTIKVMADDLKYTLNQIVEV